jgi:hypothetical protein
VDHAVASRWARAACAARRGLRQSR